MSPITFFKCLSDETRLRCMALLRKEGKLCVCELTHALNMSQPKISRHLALLRQCNLLLDSREGQWVYYQLNPELPPWVFEIMDVTVQHFSHEPNQQADFGRLQAMVGRPELKSCCS